MGATTAPALGGAVLVAAGVFQVTPWKESCLQRCRTPVGFLISEWRDGARGGLIMGVRHGAYCLGCCWALMAVLFVVGTMYLVWMAAIAGFVLLEKVAPRVLRVRYAAATILIGWGAVTLLGAGV
jgi:predicted metal-binding membrane protein